MLPQQYCLRWKYHHSNLQTMFSQLLDRGCFCDVTLACEGQLIRAHRVVLCACSTFFDTVLTNYSNERDPIIIMKDVTFADVKCLIEFMYKGEINVEHAHLASLLRTADDLKIKGLAEVTWRDDEDGPPMPTPATELYSPRHAAKAYYGNDGPRQTPSPLPNEPEIRTATRTPTPTPMPIPLKVQARLPTLTPIPHTGVDSCMPIHSSPNVEHYLGTKRKRGRPPLDDTYDVFNLRNMHQYANIEHQAYIEATRQYAEEQKQLHQQHNQHLQQQKLQQKHQNLQQQKHQHHQLHRHQHQHHQMNQHKHQQQEQQHKRQLQQEKHQYQQQLQQQHQQLQQQQQQHKQQQQQQQERSSSPAHKTAGAVAAYHEHVQQQQIKQRMRHREQIECDVPEMDDVQAESEWISSNLEVNVTETATSEEGGCQTEIEVIKQKHERKKSFSSPTKEKYIKLSASEDNDDDAMQPAIPIPIPTSATTPVVTETATTSGTTAMNQEHEHEREHKHEHEPSDRPKTPDQNSSATDDEEAADGTVPKPVEEIETAEQKHQSNGNNSTPPNTSPSSSPTTTALKVVPPPPPPPSTSLHHASHYNKYAPEGYLVNEHGILMAPDFVHAPTVAVPTAGTSSATASTSQANGAAEPADYSDMKMDDFDAADLRLTSEEITQWQDVIKMDDYLAKGRRPQFWEEPFTRRVLDAIKNKRLEMKKAARILGVSYGTLYGRYREVYGCLKHPYSGTSLRPNQLSLPPRMDYPFRSAAATLPTQLEIGKIRPKDLSELWARPQI